MDYIKCQECNQWDFMALKYLEMYILEGFLPTTVITKTNSTSLSSSKNKNEEIITQNILYHTNDVLFLVNNNNKKN